MYPENIKCPKHSEMVQQILIQTCARGRKVLDARLKITNIHFGPWNSNLDFSLHQLCGACTPLLQ